MTDPARPLEGSYQVRLRDHDHAPLAVIGQFDELEYTRAINGRDAHGWGSWRLVGARSALPVAQCGLDRVFSVRRKPPGGAWRTDFEGLQRKPTSYVEEGDDVRRYSVEGFDLKHLLKRRHILPPAGETMLTIDDHATDIMRQLVRTQCLAGYAGARPIPYLSVEDDTHAGEPLRLNFRYTKLSEELELLAGLGCDFDIVWNGASYAFRVTSPYDGTDRREGNAVGNDPVVFGLDHANLKNARWEDDRLEEVTAVYVVGGGVGAKRRIVERTSLWGADADSPWNRIEGLVDASSESSLAALLWEAEAFLVDNERTLSFTFEALPTAGGLYGVHWDLGDLVTAYYDDTRYDVRVVAVTVRVAREGETITPTFHLIRDY